MPRPIPRGWLYLLFAVSGFAGLIYESIWSHYLKLMLGHAAYAQTLVLVIFMGGMAIGSWLASRWSQSVARPLLWYAAAEGVLGISALAFDGMFHLMQGWLFDSVVPVLGSAWMVDLVKWTAAATITLPQAILLGATFPLMSAGLVRLYPQAPGNTLSWLYFTNSLGASAGVLSSGFYLISQVGLPGTILTAGLLNCLLALAVYVMERSTAAPPRAADMTPVSDLSGPQATVTAMLATALLTGAASFLYEMGWIRMLSLVLGSATHSFELMLSAFILGLALGSFYIRRRIDGAADPLRLLGWIQVIMALLALLSLPLYLYTFDAMAAAIQALMPNEQGYTGFILFSHVLCLMLMLPVTICAGMTLPLITTALLRSGRGEGSIGRVYAANTLGAIIGVLMAVHLVMPLLGLRAVVVAGAAIDLGLGVWLLLRGREVLSGVQRVALAASLLTGLGLATYVQFDPLRMASGVFRTGRATTTGEVIFHKDGKTSTVDVQRQGNGDLSIATNGKVDAAIYAGSLSADEYTMALLAVLPMSILPEARHVGVIGMGSGMTTHTLLSNPRLERVDTVEIEPAMVEGARHFGARVKNTFDDPRSHIVIEDAKTYFARNRESYDIIISEPSNPWVSGVSTLFSVEFYRQIKRYVRPGGLFVQWLQVYETDVPLLVTVFTALQAEFSNYRVYYANSGDLLIVASADREIPPLQDWVLKESSIAEQLQRVHVFTLADLEFRMLASRRTLGPYFDAWNLSANSDYFPVLDLNAPSRRFMRKSAVALSELYPYSSRLERSERVNTPTDAPASPWFNAVLVQAGLIDHYYAKSGSRELSVEMNSTILPILDDLRPARDNCDPALLRRSWLPALKLIARAYGPYLSENSGKEIAADFAATGCMSSTDAEMRNWLDLVQFMTARDWQRQLTLASQMLNEAGTLSPDATFLFAEAILAALKVGGVAEANRVLSKFGDFPVQGEFMHYLISNTN